MTYEGEIFEAVGPTMFNDVLKARRPEIYEAGFEGLSIEGSFGGERYNVEKNARKYYSDKGVTEPAGLPETVRENKTHYRQFNEQLKVHVGAEHSWAVT